MARITKRAVESLAVREREYMVWDRDIKGFGVRVHPSGRKVYLVKFRHRGRILKKTIGPCGAIPPAAARARAAEIITAARTGKDPAGRDLLARETGMPTVNELARRFVEEYVPARCKPSSAHSYESALQRHVLPRLGKRRAADITRGDVIVLHQEMRAIPFAANRTIGILSAMFTAAELWEYRPEGSNPCRHVKRFREERRQRFLSDEEYRRLGAVLREAESTGDGRRLGRRRHPAVDAHRLPPLGNLDPALGERRSGGGGATAARQQDGSQGRAPRCACGRRAASYCPRGGQPLGDHRPGQIFVLLRVVSERSMARDGCSS